MRTDNEFLVACQSLFEIHFASLCRFFANEVDLHEVEDLMQQSFMRCLECVPRFRGDSSFEADLEVRGRSIESLEIEER